MQGEEHEERVSFETAKTLKELGFDWDSYGVFDGLKLIKDKLYYNFGNANHNKYGDLISAPTQEVVRRWLRNKHDIYIDIVTSVLDNEIYYRYVVTRIAKNDEETYLRRTIDCGGDIATYEYILETAIMGALNFLKKE